MGTLNPGINLNATPMNPSDNSRDRAGFTLVELMVSVTILVLLLSIMLTITNQTSKVWRNTTSKAEQFREARDAFESMTRQISQATLNTYWGYQFDVANTTKPTQYIRQSDLRFASGSMQYGTGLSASGSASQTVRPTHGVFFQAPLGFVAPSTPGDTQWLDSAGLEDVLNTWGYYLEVGSDLTPSSNLRPSFLPSTVVPARVRSRLMELMLSANSNAIYQYTQLANPVSANQNFDWFRKALDPTGNTSSSTVRPVHVLAENIIALVILPKLSKKDMDTINTTAGASLNDYSLAPNYLYDSNTQGQDTLPARTQPSLGNLAMRALNTKNQLPPVLRVTMVAIDEQSASRLGQMDPTSDDPFRLKTAFQQASSYNAEMFTTNGDVSASLEARLINANTSQSTIKVNGNTARVPINYRIFTTDVSIRAAKWSESQTN